MASVWLSVLIVPWIHMNALIKVVHTQASACGKVNTSASVVAVDSSISASCLIDSNCPLTKGKEFRVEWKINNHLVPSNLSYLESNGAYAVFIPHIPGLSADVTCSVCVEDNCQIIDGSIVKVGYPPAIPRNLSCVMSLNVPSRMLCQWDPGQETANVPTNYTLHTNIRTTLKNFHYVISHGDHFCWIPQADMTLFFEMEIFVEAVNVFGKASSACLLLVPMKTAKYGPPEIQSIEANKFGCLEYRWSLPESQSWVKVTFYVELSIKEVNNELSKELVFPSRAWQLGTIKVCGLFHGTHYSTKMRVRYSDLWSEWSVSKLASTLIKDIVQDSQTAHCRSKGCSYSPAVLLISSFSAPSGRLDTWLKVPNDDDDDLISQLYWKPSQQFCANSWIVWYTVELKKPKQTLCVTRENYCSFKLSKWVTKVYLTASNANGSSSPTEVPVYQKKGLDPVSNVSVHSQSESSVLITWESVVSSRVTGYVLELRSLSETPAAKIFFTLMDKNQSSTLLTGFEPYKPYEISVYPKYVDGIGHCYSVTAYSSEKAPSVAPELKFGELHSSNVELLWDEIPLQQRNGIIQGYTIFFWDKRQNIQILRTKKTNVLVRDLQPLSTYNAIISVHTLGGSLNGSVVTLKTQRIGGFAVVLLLIPVCVGFCLLILIAVFTCLGKHERLKMCLWPIIPDPANSSIKRWTTTDSLQGMPPFKEDKDPALMYLSHFSFLDLSDKELCSSDYVEENQWSQESGGHNECHNSRQNTDSVPYATVVFGGPYQNQMGSPPVYLRSESTQPLLGLEDPSSPPPYENMPASVSVVNYFTTIPQQSTENEALWENFPMLRSLEIRITDHI